MHLYISLLLSALSGVNNSNTEPTILIIFYNNCERGLQQQLGNKVSSFYKLPVKIATGSLPASAFYKTRKRYRADKLLVNLSQYNSYRVIGVTDKDISCTKGTFTIGVYLV